MKLRRLPGRSRTVMSLAKCPTIPISSPAGQRLINAPKTCVNNQYVMERLDRCERFCTAPPLREDGSNRPKFMDKQRPLTVLATLNPPALRRSNAYCHTYRFPRRQFSMKWRDRAFEVLHSILLKQTNCRPVCIQLKRLTTLDIESYQLNSRLDRLKRLGQITLTRAPKTAIKTNVIDFIDLCSSDEESGLCSLSGSCPSENKNLLPRLNHSNNRRNSTNNSNNLRRTLDNLLGDSVTLEPISQINTNTNSNVNLPIKSATMRKITSQRRYTLHSDCAPLYASSRVQMVAKLSQNCNESTFNHQNQENTGRYLNGGTKGPTRAEPSPNKNKKVKTATTDRSSDDSSLVKNVTPTKAMQQLISIDLT